MRTRQQIADHPLVRSIHKEGADGWWCYVIEGYTIPRMGCGTIHEDTLADVADMLKTAVPVDNG